MTADTLREIFSDARIKVMRLFLCNPDGIFTIMETAARVQGEFSVVKNEIRMLAKVEFLKSAGSSGKAHNKKPLLNGWTLNANFELLRPLRALIQKEAPLSNAMLLKRLNTAFGSRLKLAVLSGIFLDQDSARADMVLVGDGISSPRLMRVVRSLEADVGRALNYVYFTTEEYEYRMKMSDRFLRDVLASSHETLVNRLETKKI